jgi:tetratricopeptide (TPR) repeat protein
MLSPRGTAARDSRRRALTLLLCTAVAGCRPVGAPLPLDDAPPAASAHPDALIALAMPHPAAPADIADAAATPSPASTISEEALPEVDALPPAPAVLAGAPTPPAAIPAAASSNGGAAPLRLEAPSPLGSITATTPPNVAAATRLADTARSKLAAGDDAAALEQLERAIAIDSGNPYAYFFLASLHLSHRTYDQAIAFAERAASLSQPGSPEWTSRAFALQGNAYESAGRFSDARQAYGRALQAAPNNLSAAAGLDSTRAPACHTTVRV